MSKKIFVDFYDFLEIGENASMEEIRKAYKKKMILYHPDNQIGKSEEEQKRAEINCERASNALETLSNPKKRKVFDLERNRRKQSTTSNKKTSTQTSSSSYSSAAKHTQYSAEENIAFDGTFEEYVEFMKKQGKEAPDFFKYFYQGKNKEQQENSNGYSQNSSNSSKIFEENKETSRSDDPLFHFFKDFVDMNFTNTNTDRKKNYKFYRQNTTKTQGTTFKKKYTESNDNASTHENEKNKNTQNKEETPNFSEIIQLEKRVNELNKELQGLSNEETRLTMEFNSLYNQIQNVNQYTDISKKVTGNTTYKEAKEYIANHNQRTQKFITKLLISKEDWNTFFAMQRKVEQIEAEARKEIEQELHEKFTNVSKKLTQIKENSERKRREYLSAKKDYETHSLHFKYECYKMDFTKKYQMNEEKTEHKKAI